MPTIARKNTKRWWSENRMTWPYPRASATSVNLEALPSTLAFQEGSSATMGTTVSATISDATITMQMVMPTSSHEAHEAATGSSRRKIIGMNTHIVVKRRGDDRHGDRARGAAAAPRYLASSPRSVKWREIDSMTTTELSTNIPTASIRPIRLITFSVVDTTPASGAGNRG